MKRSRLLYIGNDLAEKSKYNSAMQTLYELLTEEGYEIIKSSANKNSFLRLLDMLFSVVKNKKVDYMLIDTFSTSAFYYAFLTSQLARLCKMKYIPILHGGDLPNRLKKSPKMCRLIFNNSYKNIAPSNYLLTRFKNEGYDVEYIPNPIKIDAYKYKERINLEPKILWVRAFKNIYNPTLAIEVIRILKEKYTNVKLCMIGPFKDDTINKVKSLVEKYNLQDEVEITGVLPKEQWHERSVEFDIFLNTTNIDNTPVSVIEAMALGLPIVSTNVGGIPYLIENTVDGILVQPKDPNTIVDALSSIIEINNVQLAKNARKKAVTFGWREVRKKWLNILADVS